MCHAFPNMKPLINNSMIQVTLFKWWTVNSYSVNLITTSSGTTPVQTRLKATPSDLLKTVKL